MTQQQRSTTFRRIKAILQRRGLPDIVRYGSLQYLQDYLNRLNQQRPIRPFAQQIRAGKRLKATFPYHTGRGAIRARTYFVNDLNLSSSDIPALKYEVTPRLKHALRTGITKRSDVVVRFIFNDNETTSSKSFNSFLITNEQDFWDMIQRYNDLNTTNNANYTHTVVGIQIRIIAENAGGCVNRSKKTRIGNSIHIAPKASNNNCFFICSWDLLNLGVKRLGKAKGNEIRREFGLINDALIPISTALDIYKRYRSDPNTDLEITDNATLETLRTGANVVRRLVLTDNHFTQVELSESKKCDKCGQVYFKTHNTNACTLERQMFYQAKVKKINKRFLLCGNKAEPFNNQSLVIHYDWETYQNKSIVDGQAIHTPYIVGYNEGTEFKYIAGDKCVINFTDYVLRKGLEIENEDNERGLKKKRTLFVNAYNGANFDHYFLFQEFLRRGLKPDKQIINNGSIVSFQYKNIKLFDVCKHLQGSLSDNLKALDCDVQKGDFDHNKASRWEDMTMPLKENCLLYLKSDVLGLREIYNKINTTIYDEYKVNLSSYISTSSLTFNMWKKAIRNKYCVELPNLEQEKAFRQSVRGGRTYKSKHKFISQEYDDYKNGKIDFDDIKDYVIDADVVSLYPTAMAHYPYPVGACLESKDNKMHGKIGIYKIKYEANKNLIHAIGGRRTNAGLKWDLLDSDGWYTSVDIEDMIANGYKVEIHQGYYWNEVAYIFKEYIEELFQKKKIEADAGRKGSVTYMLTKLWMNGLYGKNIQRPIYNTSKVINSNKEYWEFWGKHIINDITTVKKGDEVVWFVSGTPRELKKKTECITKPTQLGAFILAYSRRIMLGFMKEANPYFDISHDPTPENKLNQIENDIYYTDTDSLQMHVRNARLIKDLGKKSLGGITDDLGDNCKIIKGLWIAPKLYMLEYIKKDKDNSVSTHYHFRGKGLNKDALNVDQFEAMSIGKSLKNTREFQMKKIHIKKNSNQKEIPEFSIVHYSKEVNEKRLTRLLTPRRGRGESSRVMTTSAYRGATIKIKK